MIAVIVINWNGINFIQKCLDGLRGQTCRNYSIIMVDNGSDDGSLELVHSKYPEVRTIALSDNMGFAVANNIAIKSMDIDYIALINNDAVPHPEWLENLQKALEINPDAGIETDVSHRWTTGRRRTGRSRSPSMGRGGGSSRFCRSR